MGTSSGSEVYRRAEKEFAGIVTEKQAILGVSDAVFNRMTYFRGAQEHFNILLMELEEKISMVRKLTASLRKLGY